MTAKYPATNDMRIQLTRSVHRALAEVTAKVPPFPSNVPELQEHSGPGTFLAALRPHFYRDDSATKLACAQCSWFGFYALRAAVRGVLMSVNHLTAAVSNHRQKLHGPATVNAYTAAFHVLHGYLALEGRVIYDPGPGGDLGPVRVVLTQKGTWSVENTKRNHRSPWLELKSTLSKRKGRVELPTYFEQLFEYTCSRRYRPGIKLIEKLRNPNVGLVPMRERLDEFLPRIAELRHIAAYGSFGDDPYLTEALWNNDATGGDFGRQVTRVIVFATQFLEDVAGRVADLVDLLDWSPHSLKLFGLSVLLPDFDEPVTDGLGGDLRDHVERVRRTTKPPTAL